MTPVEERLAAAEARIDELAAKLAATRLLELAALGDDVIMATGAILESAFAAGRASTDTPSPAARRPRYLRALSGGIQ